MNQCEISVIIPVFNRKELLKEAVTSVLAQTFPNWELIIADDGSDDGTLETAYSLAQEDSRIRVLSLPHSGFPGIPRNRAAEKAKAPWLAFLDSDDLWMPEKLEKQYNLAKQDSNICLIHTREVWLRGDRIISQKSQKHKHEGDLFTEALVKCIIGPSTVMIKRDVFTELGGFREDLEIAEDYELWLRFCAGHGVSYLDEPLITKRADHGSLQLSEKYGQIEIFRIKALEKLIKSNFLSINYPEKLSAARQELIRKCRIYADGCEKRGRFDEAEIYRKRTENQKNE